MMLLTKAQAEAVYNAMCSLNNVGAALDCRIPLGHGSATRVYEAMNGSVHVAVYLGRREWKSVEKHETLTTFAAAYGLQQG